MSRRGVRSRSQRPILKVVPGGSALPPASRRPALPPRTLALASGKGGVGKTSLSVNLALALADLDRRVLVVDGDLGLGKIDLLIGVEPAGDLSHFLSGTRSLEEVVTVGPRGVGFLPAGCGHRELAVLEPWRREQLIAALLRLALRFDFVLMDLPTGIGPNALELARRADEVLVVTTPEPTACLDAYALTKLLLREDAGPVRLVVNRARDREDAREAFIRIARTSGFHLGGAPGFLGHVPEDPVVQDAVRLGKPFVMNSPASPSAHCVRELALRILGAGIPGGDGRVLRPGSSRPFGTDRAQAA